MFLDKAFDVINFTPHMLPSDALKLFSAIPLPLTTVYLFVVLSI